MDELEPAGTRVKESIWEAAIMDPLIWLLQGRGAGGENEWKKLHGGSHLSVPGPPRYELYSNPD